jgi:DNA-binding NarL/FixJ family response regulator
MSNVRRGSVGSFVPGRTIGGKPTVGGQAGRHHRSIMFSVLIVDDHAGFRTAARRAFERAGWDVVGEAADGRTGLEAARAAAPDVVLLDVQLPDISGLDVAATLIGDPTHPPVVLTATRAAEDVEPLLPPGACGFVPKERLSAEAVGALLAVD